MALCCIMNYNDQVESYLTTRYDLNHLYGDHLNDYDFLKSNYKFAMIKRNKSSFVLRPTFDEIRSLAKSLGIKLIVHSGILFFKSEEDRMKIFIAAQNDHINFECFVLGTK